MFLPATPTTHPHVETLSPLDAPWLPTGARPGSWGVFGGQPPVLAVLPVLCTVWGRPWPWVVAAATPWLAAPRRVQPRGAVCGRTSAPQGLARMASRDLSASVLITTRTGSSPTVARQVGQRSPLAGVRYRADTSSPTKGARSSAALAAEPRPEVRSAASSASHSRFASRCACSFSGSSTRS